MMQRHQPGHARARRRLAGAGNANQVVAVRGRDLLGAIDQAARDAEGVVEVGAQRAAGRDLVADEDRARHAHAQGPLDGGELRLPATKATLERAQAANASFTRLIVFVDSDDDVAETDEGNNLYAFAREQILPVARTEPGGKPVEKPAELPKFYAGSDLVLTGDQFGSQPGSIVLQIDSIRLHVEFVSWNATGLHLKLPALALVDKANARLLVTSTLGRISDPLLFELLPPEIQAGAETGVDTNDPGYGEWRTSP